MENPEVDAFTEAARGFLDAHAPRASEPSTEWGVGDDRLSAYAKRTIAEEDARLAAARRWKTLEFDAGFGWITGPPQHGGSGLTATHQRAYIDLRSQYDVPPLNAFTISLGMVAPAILDHGDAELATKYVRAMHRGELIGCQLFSEPGAGSDVAGLSTKAERDGDHWLINGQKVWTSGAHHSQVGLLLARSDAGAPKHKGITAFALPMDTPGVQVRPLAMITGGTEFNEVFLDDVRVPDSYRLGPVDGGWGVATSVLMNERALGAGDAFGLRAAVRRLLMMARQPQFQAQVSQVRQRIAELVTRMECIRYQSLAADARRKVGLPPGPAETSFKLANTNALRLTTEIAAELLGARMLADTGEWGTFVWADEVLTAAGYRLAGGTDEILRNILAERVLGLPKEPTL